MDMPSVEGLATRLTEDYVLSYPTEAASGTAAPDGTLTTAKSAFSSKQMLDDILVFLNEDKAEDIVSIDLRGRSEIADFMVVCSGRSSRQVTAIAEKLTDHLKHAFDVYSKLEGKEQGDWVLVDAFDVIVHVFRPEVREFYQLEKMWLSTGAAGDNN